MRTGEGHVSEDISLAITINPFSQQISEELAMAGMIQVGLSARITIAEFAVASMQTLGSLKAAVGSPRNSIAPLPVDPAARAAALDEEEATFQDLVAHEEMEAMHTIESVSPRTDIQLNLGQPGIGPAGMGFAFSVHADGRITNALNETVGRVALPPSPRTGGDDPDTSTTVSDAPNAPDTSTASPAPEAP